MSEDISTVTYREIPGYPGYRAGDDGSVWSRLQRVWRKGLLGSTWEPGGAWRQLKPLVHRGYSTVVIYPGQKRTGVHRLVLLAFTGEAPAGLDACHNDGNPANNRLSNLRWDTREGNMADAKRQGRMRRGERHGGAKLTEEAVRFIRANAPSMKQKDIAARLGVTRSLVSSVLRGKCWAWLK